MENSVNNQRSYFWFSVSVGIFVGLLFGFAGSSIVSSVRLHDVQMQVKNREAFKLMPSQVTHGHFGQAPKFSDLINQNGQKIASKQFEGKVQVVSFLAPYGIHKSPVIAGNLMNVYQGLKRSHLLGSKVVFVSFNLDPRHAGTKVLSRFMQSVAGIPPSGSDDWEFLTGSEGQIGKIVAGRYGVHYRALDAKAYLAYAKQKKAQGQFDYAQAINPVAGAALPHNPIVDHDEIVLVSPGGAIKVVIKQASAFPPNRLLYEIVSMLKLPGMGK